MMYIQAHCNIVVGNFRVNRKRFSFNGRSSFLLAFLFFIAQQVVARPNQDEDLSRHLKAGDDCNDVDNLKTHPTKVTDILSQENHPVIIYKEDFVSEDYDVEPLNKKKTCISGAFDSSCEEISVYTSNLGRKQYGDDVVNEIHMNPDVPHMKNQRNEEDEEYRLIEVKNLDDSLRKPFDTKVDTILVPSKNEAKSEKSKRRYKDIGNRRRHSKQNVTDVFIEEKPEKILFDIIPEKPLIVPEDMEKYRKSHMKLVPLTNDFSEGNESSIGDSSVKDELLKRPKKYHHRVRRGASGEHIVSKRNPYFRHIPKNPSGEVAPTQVQYIYVKHAVAGKKHNGLDLPIPRPQVRPSVNPNENVSISFETRVAADENDRVIFSGSGKRRTTQGTTESIFRDPRPENFDFSFMNAQARSTTARPPIFTVRPERGRQEESIFRDPRPENFDFSFMSPQQQQSSVNSVRIPAPTESAKSAAQTGVSQCVWAIVICCSNRNSEIRYACFEQNGCYGAFWGLNPCADNVRDSSVNFVADYYN